MATEVDTSNPHWSLKKKRRDDSLWEEAQKKVRIPHIVKRKINSNNRKHFKQIRHFADG